MTSADEVGTGSLGVTSAAVRKTRETWKYGRWRKLDDDDDDTAYYVEIETEWGCGVNGASDVDVWGDGE